MAQYSSTIYDESQAWSIGDFNFEKMVPQRSANEARMARILRKYADHIPLFSISPTPDMFVYSKVIAIHLHIRVKNTNKSSYRDNTQEVRTLIPTSVFEAATDEEVSRWIYQTIVDTRRGSSLQTIDILGLYQIRFSKKFRNIKNLFLAVYQKTFPRVSRFISELTKGRIILNKDI